MEKIKIKMVSELEDKDWANYNPEIMVPGWETWADADGHPLENGKLMPSLDWHPEYNKYCINFPAECFEIIEL